MNFRRSGFLACTATAVLLSAISSAFAATSTDPFLDGPADTPGSITITQPAPRAAGRGDAAPVGNPLWSVPLSSLSATRERPIFSPTRRPPPRAVAGPPVVPIVAPPPPRPPPQPLTLALLGAVVSDNEAIAVFLDRSTQSVVRLRAGQVHNGWTVNAVLPREVTLTRGNQSETVGLPKGGESTVPIAGLGTSGTVPGVGIPGIPGVTNSVPGVGGSGGYAPFVPRSTPRDGSSDGL